MCTAEVPQATTLGMIGPDPDCQWWSSCWWQMASEMNLQRLAARQHGLASRKQLLDLGFSRRQISTRATSGHWRRAAPQVYDVVPGARDPRRALHAAVMSSGGLSSHRSTAELRKLVDKTPARPDILVVQGHLPKGLEATIHRSRHLRPADRTSVDGIPCTSTLRTLLDLAAVVDEETLEDALSRAVVLRLTTMPKLQRYLAAEPLVGRPGGAALRHLLASYDDLRMVESRLEVIVMRAVRSSKLPPPTRQLKLVLDGRNVRLDLAWPDERVFVEADGFGFHSDRVQFRRDRERQNALVLGGWLPLRYTWAVARTQPDRIVDEITTVLAARRASPSSP